MRNGTLGRLYNGRNFMWRRSEQNCNGTHLVIQGVLLRFLHLGKLMAPRRNILFVIRFSLPCSNQPNTFPICPFPTPQPWFLEF